jgi:phage terminase large subunit
MSTMIDRLGALELDADELLEAHRGEARDFSEYRDDPVRFLREVLKFEPWGRQVEVAESVARHKRTVVRGCHGAGKDAVLAALLLWAAYSRGMLCLAISATERQLTGQLWRELRDRFTASQLPGELFSSDLRIAGAKRVIAMTSGSTSNLTGWHDPAGVFVAISESQAEQVEAAAFDAAEGNTASEGCRIIVVGNPVRAQGRFFEVSRKPTWHAIAISAFDHPNVAGGRATIPGGPAPDWPTEMAREYGEESAFYIGRVLGEFPTEGSVDALLRRQWIDDAFDRHDAGVAFTALPLPVLALDVARSVDRDESVAAIVQGTAVHALHAWRSRDLVVTADRFAQIADRSRLAWLAATSGRTIATAEDNAVLSHADALERWLSLSNVPQFKLYVDAPGVGSGVVDELRRIGRPVTEYWGWRPADDDRRFANARAEHYWRLRTLLDAGDLALPRDVALADELAALEWTLDNRGRIVMLSKEELRRSLGRSPDRADACVIGLAGGAGAVFGPTVSFESISM